MAGPGLKLKLVPTNGVRFKMTKQQPLTGAERQRRYRQRQKYGLRVFPVVLDDADLERLIDTGWLDEREGLDCDCVVGAIEGLVGSLDRPKE